MSLAYDTAVGLVRSLYDRSITTPPVLDPVRYFPNATRFTERWHDIRSEALATAAELKNIPRFHDIMPQQRDISANDGRDWRMLILKAYGVEIPQNLRRCPTIASLLEQTPEAVSCILSFLAPGKHIPVHRGPFRGILRLHLMLSMSHDEMGRPACVMEIDSVPYDWPTAKRCCGTTPTHTKCGTAAARSASRYSLMSGGKICRSTSSCSRGRL